MNHVIKIACLIMGLACCQCQEVSDPVLSKSIHLQLINSYDFESAAPLRIEIGDQILFEQPLNSLDGHAKRFAIEIEAVSISELRIYLGEKAVAIQTIDLAICDCLYIDVWGKPETQPAQAEIHPFTDDCPQLM